jgi:hypothetical protein
LLLAHNVPALPQFGVLSSVCLVRMPDKVTNFLLNHNAILKPMTGQLTEDP